MNHLLLIYRNILPGFILLSLVICFSQASQSESMVSEKHLKMDVMLTQYPSTNLVLNIKLKNISPDTLETYSYKLPWGNAYSMTLILIKENDPLDPPIKRQLIIDDPPNGRTVILPGEIHIGKVHLPSIFPSLETILKQQNVMLFWSYRFQPLNKPPLDRLGGFILLKKWPQ